VREIYLPNKLPLHFNGHFPCGPGLAGARMYPFWILLELGIMGSGGANHQSNVTSKN